MEIIFYAVIVYKLLVQKKYEKFKLKIALKFMANKGLQCLKKANMSNSKIMTDFESILAPEDKGKQNPEESYTNKYQKHIACRYGYKLVCVDDKLTKPSKVYLSKDAVYNFINSMIAESKY